ARGGSASTNSGACAAFARKTSVCSAATSMRSEEHTSELQSLTNLVCRLLLEKKKKKHKFEQKMVTKTNCVAAIALKHTAVAIQHIAVGIERIDACEIVTCTTQQASKDTAHPE